MAAPTQHIEFINDQEQAFFAEAMLGEEVRQFLTSTTGIFLHGRAKLVYNECVKKLFEIDPYTQEGKQEYEKIKREAWCANSFMQWCAEAIINGDIAETQLQNYRQEED